MDPQPVEHGSIAACFQRQNAIALWKEARKMLGHGWGFAWPNDCRIIYNRASARPDGKPWSERKKLVWWDESKRQWTGLDTPDYDKDTATRHRTQPSGTAAERKLSAEQDHSLSSRRSRLVVRAERAEGWPTAHAL